MMFKNTIKNFSTHDPNHKVIEVVLKVSWKLVESFGTKSKVFWNIKYMILFLTKRIEK